MGCVCKFCYKITSVISTQNDGLVNRFSKLIRCDIQIDTRSGGWNGLDGKDKYFSCCRDCQIIINSLCDLNHQLKCLELQLELRLGSLVSIMKLANRVPSRLQRLKQMLSEDNVQEDSSGFFQKPFENPMAGNKLRSDQLARESKMKERVKYVEACRKCVIRKCIYKLSKSQPRVLVRRLDNVESCPSPVNFSGACNFIQEQLSDANRKNITSVEYFIGWMLSFSAVAMLVATPTANDSELASDVLAAITAHNETNHTGPLFSLDTDDVIGQDLYFNLPENSSDELDEVDSLKPQSPISHDAMEEEQLEEKPAVNQTEVPDDDKSWHFHQSSIYHENESSVETPISDPKVETGALSAFISQVTPTKLATNRPRGSVRVGYKKSRSLCRFQCRICEISYKYYGTLYSHKLQSRFHQIRKKNCAGKVRIKVKKDFVAEADTTRLIRKIIATNSGHATKEQSEAPSTSTPTRYNLRKRIKRPYDQIEDGVTLGENDSDTDNHDDSASSHSDYSSSSSSESDISSEGLENVDKKTDTSRNKKFEVDEGELGFKCSLCAKHFSRIKYLTKHKRKFHREDGSQLREHASKSHRSIFVCPVVHCTANFRSREDLESHEKLHGSFKCNFCDEIKKYAPDLAVHEAQVHAARTVSKINTSTKSRRTLQCARCPANFLLKSLLTRHFLHKHLKISGPGPSCTVCGAKSIVTRDDRYLKFHFERYHKTDGLDPSQIHKCDQCPAYFIRENLLSNHQIDIHHKKKCPNCGISVANNTQLKRHLTLAHSKKKSNTRRLHCDFGTCDKRFLKEATLDRHKKKCRHKNKFGCRVYPCELNFNTQEDLSYHQRLHGKFRCEFCEVVKKFAPHLALHEAKKHAERDDINTEVQNKNVVKKTFNCARCPSIFDLKRSLIMHFLRKHFDVERKTKAPYFCRICGIEQKKSYKNNNHFERFHKIDKLDPTDVQRCDQCPAYFIQRMQLVYHKLTVHYQRKCPECGKSFTKLGNLRKHIGILHPKFEITPEATLFPCDLDSCKQVFVTEADLESHKKHASHTCDYVEQKRFQCSECGKRLKTKASLQRHMIGIHGSDSHVCQECGKTFKTEEYLNSHLNSHKGPELWKFQCSNCGRKFASKQKVEQHMRTHTKEKPFVCQYCGEKYAHRHNWRNHVKTKHGEQDVSTG